MTDASESCKQAPKSDWAQITVQTRDLLEIKVYVMAYELQHMLGHIFIACVGPAASRDMERDGSCNKLPKAANIGAHVSSIAPRCYRLSPKLHDALSHLCASADS